MEKAYWLGRERASLKLAKVASSPQARLIHYDLAGRYSLKAHSAETQAVARVDARPPTKFAEAASRAAKEASNA
jgi:hypothetical protein